mgnify:CR=1 FL=1
MSCGGCAGVRAAGFAAARAYASGDTAALNKAIADLDAIAKGDFKDKPVKQAVTRGVEAGLSRLAARMR